MLTKEEVLGIIDYCRRHNVPIKKRLSSLGIGEWTYYKSKKIYLGGHNTPGTGNNGGFVRLSTSADSSVQGRAAGGSSGLPEGISGECAMELECLTAGGGTLRIRGILSAEHLSAIIRSL
jgi:hypothetical protein